MKRDLDRRLVALETRQAVTLHRRTLTTPTYMTARPGEPRPNVDGPVLAGVTTMRIYDHA